MKVETNRDSMVRHFANIEWLHQQSISTIKNLPNNIDKQQANEEARKLFLTDMLKKFEGKTITTDLAEQLSDVVINGWQTADAVETAAYKMWATYNLYKEKIEVLKAVLDEYAKRCCHTLVDIKRQDVSDGYACAAQYVTTYRCRICNKSWEDR